VCVYFSQLLCPTLQESSDFFFPDRYSSIVSLAVEAGKYIQSLSWLQLLLSLQLASPGHLMQVTADTNVRAWMLLQY
jgi:hypothetical protein